MFAGLILTTISAAVMPAALFQRKSRSGWLEELDGIRQDALDQHDGGVAPVGEADDIWTDLRDGGEYEDPHEISSLYATDATPDLPVSKPAKPAARPAPARNGKAKAKPAAADAPPPPPPAAANGTLPPPPAAVLPPPPPPAAAVPPPVTEVPLPTPPAPIDAPAAAAPPAPAAEVAAERPGTGEAPGAPQYDDQIWVQPAPHPIRPSEMWHPAELSPPPLPEESFEPVLEERVASADLMDPTYRSVPEPAPAPAPAPAAAADARTVAELESELASVADLTVAPPASSGGLVNGPVGRRVRRDRPAERPKASLPPPDAHAAPAAPVDRGEQSPLPTAPLPPAALPTRSNRLPGLETLPATPSSVVPPRPVPEPAVPAAAAPAPEPAPAPAAPVAAAEPAPVPEPPAPAPIVIGADGMVDAPGTIVRIGGARRAHASGNPAGVVVNLDEGWCWASPGEGAASSLRIDLPSGSLVVEPGATALAVVEADRSVFILVAAGSTHLARGEDGAAIDRGTIVMIDPAGVAQTDVATDAEIEADPIVAENLALDAEL